MRNPNIKRPHLEMEFSPDDIQEIKKCKESYIYFIEKYVRIKHATKGMVPMILYDYQKRMLDSIHNNRLIAILASRQTGKTTVVAMYLLWMTCFQDDKDCVIASKNLKHAVLIMSRVKTAYEQLPDFIKPGCKYYSRTSIEFENGSSIHNEATTENTGRGNSPAFLMLDELAFANKRIQQELWASISPSLATGGKLVITSTPNGDADLFANIWRQAKAGLNNFTPVTAMWYEHPDQGEEYYKEQLGLLGPIKVKQEIDCIFLSSDALLINSIMLHNIRAKEVVFEDMGFKFWKPADQIGGRGKMYLMGVDPATGNGNDFTAIQVFEFPSLNQVAEFRSNSINIPLIYAKIKWILKYLTRKTERGRAEAMWSFERNGVGEALVALIQNDDEKDGGVYIDNVELYNESDNKLGVYTTGSSKTVCCLQLKSLIEKGNETGIKIYSDMFLFELQNFVASGGSYKAKIGCTDDVIMAAIVLMKVLQKYASYNDKARQMVYESVLPNSDESVEFSDDSPVMWA
jgi:hypothetical protein